MHTAFGIGQPTSSLPQINPWGASAQPYGQQPLLQLLQILPQQVQQLQQLTQLQQQQIQQLLQIVPAQLQQLQQQIQFIPQQVVQTVLYAQQQQQPNAGIGLTGVQPQGLMPFQFGSPLSSFQQPPQVM